jgi:hypothetical protein
MMRPAQMNLTIKGVLIDLRQGYRVLIGQKMPRDTMYKTIIITKNY